MGKVKIETDIVAAKFIATAILFQKEGGIIFENDTEDSEFAEIYDNLKSHLTNFASKYLNYENRMA